MATIILIKQLADWLDGKLLAGRVKRNTKPLDLSVRPTIAVNPQRHTGSGWTGMINFDRFNSYKKKIMPKLQGTGYLCFLACNSTDYQIHEEWCHEHCEKPTLPHCDVWQMAVQYPRAFISETDAALFALSFDISRIDKNKLP